MTTGVKNSYFGIFLTQRGNPAHARLSRAFVQGLLLFCLLLGHGIVYADARLMVSPTRVVFEGISRSAEVNLINAGTSTGTFRVSFERKRMTDDGAYVDIGKDESGMFADPYIRFSPRQVTLEPGQSQTVRLMLRKPADLPDGEYRSHMLFQAIPDDTASNIEQQILKDRSGVTIRLIPVLGISIPVIIRQGKLEAAATLSHLNYQAPTQANPASLSMVINRSGTESVYADVIVKYRPKGGGGKEYVVGLAKGVAVFTPNALRKFTVSLQQPQGVAFHGGDLEVDYRQSEDQGGKLFASATISIAQ